MRCEAESACLVQPTEVCIVNLIVELGEIVAKNIYVGNLSYSTSEADVEKLFSQYGPIDSVKIITDRQTGRSKGFGFVEMTNAEDADKAIAELNGKDVGGRALTVNEARPREAGGGDRGGRGGNRGGRGGRGGSRNGDSW